jgi:hypothetical protein
MNTRWHQQDCNIASGKRWYAGTRGDGAMDRMAITHGIASSIFSTLYPANTLKKNNNEMAFTDT